MGAALTFARRYALFTLVGIAGEDDLDAPDLITPTKSSPEMPRPGGDGQFNGVGGSLSFHDRRGSTGRAQTKPILGTEASAQLRDRLLSELTAVGSGDDAAKWAHGILAEKNKLNAADAQIVEDSFRAKLEALGSHGACPTENAEVASPQWAQPRQHEAGLKNGRSSRMAIDKSALAMPEPRRVRDRAHVTFVARHPCLICGRLPADAHHLRFAQSRALSRKVSDEFTVRCAADTIERFITAAMKRRGGVRQVSIRSSPLARFGLDPSTARKSAANRDRDRRHRHRSK